MTSPTGENYSHDKRSVRFCDIFIFVIEISHFLTPTLFLNFPYFRITLRARKALRVVSACFTFFDQISPAPVLLVEQEKLYESYKTIFFGAKHLSRCFAPGRAAKIQFRPHLHVCDPKIWCHTKTYPSVQLFLKR